MVRGKVLVVAGSDSGGGAGIQADIKTCLALGAFATTAITALTAQNTLGVHGVHPTPLDFVDAQIDAVVSDLPPDAVKTGMLANAETVTRVASAIKSRALKNVVVDTVMIAKGGASLLETDAIGALRGALIPLATVITPNVPEAAALLGMDEKDFNRDAMESRCRELGKLGCAWVLLKGGHVVDDLASATDHLYDVRNDLMRSFTAPRITTHNTHGTGCTFASAIAASLAQGMDVPSAVRRAKAYVSAAIASNPGFGSGHGPLNHLPFYAASAGGLSALNTDRSSSGDDSGSSGGDSGSRGSTERPFDRRALRLYLVTCDALTEDKLRDALAAGVTMVQMRDKTTASTRELIAKARAMKRVCDAAGVPFIVNDRVDVAIAVDACGVHLGQSDAPCSFARALLGPGKIVGVSARTPELASEAKRDGADYVGSGACFGTESKGDAKVIGLEGVRAVAERCEALDLPVVAIGGITTETGKRAREETRADGIAVISCVANAPDVAAAVRALL
jgi:hydroxymethylpyrimidine kinase/phosphomethylpyrimidine kinase/thiamine-phosphate diphosphorylase